MSTRSKHLSERYVQCPNCNKKILIWSKNYRGKNHVKTMYCYYCGKLVDMKELDKYGLDYEEDKTGIGS